MKPRFLLGKKIAKRQKIPPVKEQIEKTGKIATHEMVWTKAIGGPMRKAAWFRGRSIVIRNPFKKGKFEIHSHPAGLGGFLLDTAMPSPTDFRGVLARIEIEVMRAEHAAKHKLAYNKPIKTCKVISSISLEGKEIGRTILRPTKELNKRIKMQPKQTIEEMKKIWEESKKLEKLKKRFLGEAVIQQLTLMDGNITNPTLRSKASRKLEELKKKQEQMYDGLVEMLKKVGFQIRFVPMPGYEFNKIYWCFIKKQK